MERVSGEDAVFLSMERPTWHQHVGGLLIFDRSSAPGFTFNRFSALVAQRLPLAPRFACQIREVPFGLDRPLWVKDPNLNVANHLHHCTLPSPGRMRELAGLVGELMGHQLDRGRPLWEIWFIEGLEDDRVALLCKTHHCMMDGMSGQGLAAHLFDLEPDAPPRPIPAAAEAGPEPSDAELVARGLLPTLTAPLSLGRYATQLVARGLAVLPFLRGDNRALTPLDAPATPWNASLSSRRALAFVSVPLDDLRSTSQRRQAKMNDIVLALVTTALRNYLLANGCLPDKPLICGVPVSTRDSGAIDIGNKFATMFVALPVMTDDPLRRLAIIQQSSVRGKEMLRAARVHPMRALGESVPPVLLNLAFGAMFAAQLDQRIPAAANILVSNIRGPSFPLYSAGALLVALYPIGPLMMGMGLNCTVMSYRDSVEFGVQCDPQLIPEPWLVTDHIPDALAELNKTRKHRTPNRKKPGHGQEQHGTTAALVPDANAAGRPTD